MEWPGEGVGEKCNRGNSIASNTNVKNKSEAKDYYILCSAANGTMNDTRIAHQTKSNSPFSIDLLSGSNLKVHLVAGRKNLNGREITKAKEKDCEK